MAETEVRVLATQVAALERRVAEVETDHKAMRDEQRESAIRIYDKIDRLSDKVDQALQRRDDREIQGTRGSLAVVVSVALSVAAFAGTILVFVLGVLRK